MTTRKSDLEAAFLAFDSYGFDSVDAELDEVTRENRRVAFHCGADWQMKHDAEMIKLLKKELDCLYSVLSEDPLNELRTDYTQWFVALELKEKRKKLENDNA